jgi:hypothetical protein
LLQLDLLVPVDRLQNFVVQGNGSAMMQAAAILATERGLRIWPVHDAFLVVAPLAELDDAVATMQECMARASAMVLGGYRLQTKAKTVRWPERYQDEGGEVMWDRVWARIGQSPDSNQPSPAKTRT